MLLKFDVASLRFYKQIRVSEALKDLTHDIQQTISRVFQQMNKFLRSWKKYDSQWGLWVESGESSCFYFVSAWTNSTEIYKILELRIMRAIYAFSIVITKGFRTKCDH